jgi:branched-chain amino acid transport system substrate-binding protein
MWTFFIPDAQALQYAKESETIKIGLLIADKKSIAARQGAEMAILEANKKGGFNGRPFELVVRSMEGPWGTGSKEAVNLVFEEKVWAIMGSHDGRNAHLVEQAATKAGVVFLSAWASDPTLSQAFVPWFFNCVPNDLQQAASLIEEIYNKRNINKIAVVSGNDYDSKMAMESFLKQTKLAGKTSPVQFSYENSSQDFNVLADQINKADVNCIIFFGQPSASLKIIQLIRQRNMSQPVFGTLSLLDENKLSEQELQNYEKVILVPSGDWSGSKNSAFRQEFQKTYNKLPGMVAAYAFDGMSILIEAIRNAGGPDREKIQKSLAKIYYKGVTGLIQFDDRGNRSGTYDLMYIRNGLPVTVER